MTNSENSNGNLLGLIASIICQQYFVNYCQIPGGVQEVKFFDSPPELAHFVAFTLRISRCSQFFASRNLKFLQKHLRTSLYMVLLILKVKKNLRLSFPEHLIQDVILSSSGNYAIPHPLLSYLVTVTRIRLDDNQNARY